MSVNEHSSATVLGMTASNAASETTARGARAAYEACPVLKALSPRERGNRLALGRLAQRTLALGRLAQRTLAQGLGLLGIAAPTHM